MLLVERCSPIDTKALLSRSSLACGFNLNTVLYSASDTFVRTGVKDTYRNCNTINVDQHTVAFGTIPGVYFIKIKLNSHGGRVGRNTAVRFGWETVSLAIPAQEVCKVGTRIRFAILPTGQLIILKVLHDNNFFTNTRNWSRFGGRTGGWHKSWE